jgi:diguanylate cyclase (GGDEF)-like protein
MSEIPLASGWRLIRLMLLALVTMGGISILWEFRVERWVMGALGWPYDTGFEDAERWRFIFTSTAFSLLSLVVPTALLNRLAKNTRLSYRRLLLKQSKTETLARYDSLSGLINRRVLMELLGERLETAVPSAIFLVDLDHFKSINDTYGHSVGDDVIWEVASRLEDIALEHNGVAARLGGDEFCLLLLNDPGEEGLERLGQTIIARLSAPMPSGVIKAWKLSATVGIARSCSGVEDASTLLHHADVAMYHGKQSGRSVYTFYSPAYEAQRYAQIELDKALRLAIEREEFIPFLQPIVALPQQNIMGYEVLARWLKPNGEIGMPTDFIPMLDRLGLIPEMTQSLIRQACTLSRHWTNDLHLSFNVSAAMIIEEDFADRLIEQLRHENFAFHRFEVEITEEALVGNLEAAKRSLSKLHAHGITVALDDFGTGYSGLYHLTRLAIDKIKIDRSFFETGDIDKLPMVEAILGMARSLNMQVTAEGIEDFHLPHLPTWLANNGCQFAQGYHFGRPQPFFNIEQPVAGDLDQDLGLQRVSA